MNGNGGVAAIGVKGDIPSIVKNEAGIYDGNLKEYLKVVFLRAKNLGNPYHNARHLLHVLWLCYKACIFYDEILTPREKRNLLVAALFHDFDHSGLKEPDSEQVQRSIAGFLRNCLDEDREYAGDITSLIRITEFPYRIPSEQLELRAQILRDADLSQSLSVAWIQPVIFGLAEEWNMTPLDILKMQEGFLGNLKFATEWARQTFPENCIKEKIEEAKELLAILEE